MILQQILIWLECLELLLGVKTFVLDCHNSNDLEYCGWISDEATGSTTNESSPKHLEPTQPLIQCVLGIFL
jgi:hypothetical protein